LMNDLSEEELSRLRSFAHPAARAASGDERGQTDSQAMEEARRCLDCDCGNRDDCRLRLLAEDYDAASTRFRGERRPFERDASHAEVVYESGKCIQCGICVRLAEEAKEELGLTFMGRGFPCGWRRRLPEASRRGSGEWPGLRRTMPDRSAGPEAPAAAGAARE